MCILKSFLLVLLVALVRGVYIPIPDADAACHTSCSAACYYTTGGVAAFAGPLGIAVDYTGCAGVCMTACAAGSLGPPACFSNATRIVDSARCRRARHQSSPTAGGST
uniref:Uncharacterized protein n=1 Tax=Neobodo designis TaxID=312471 RepID=A0A7S1PU54_NEODS|mmetsp:Transcript_20338/g.63200  ORF Transcript_20338/g.63200 Transcript_20338/m.63200 type:complete len:108 (+) Transcript_20338:70-393(+)|eukprot:CAMPEP_0174853568 /NCGR_PEP_ID=MMETSP1114-20130205/28997_1 /TAXON_ID=312471 /ORGANISM="Neobodo designis, Strain CCAP 1951/1" /LENGTH=107 /DNA_ID=CAMNT_0016088223 /DNA_START=66 /DNA_END=389 /DNA_ORIENTATION=+